jgi:hypothetical protein
MKKSILMIAILLLAMHASGQTLIITATANPICPGGSTTLSAGTNTYTGYYFYEWQQDIGGTYTVIGAYPTIDVTPISNTNYRLVLLDFYSVVIATSSPYTVTMKPIPLQPSIIGTSTFSCLQADTLTTPFNSLYTYSWHINAWDTNGIVSTTSTFINYDTFAHPYNHIGVANPSTSYFDSIYVIVTDTSGCSNKSDVFVDTTYSYYYVYPDTGIICMGRITNFNIGPSVHFPNYDVLIFSPTGTVHVYIDSDNYNYISPVVETSAYNMMVIFASYDNAHNCLIQNQHYFLVRPAPNVIVSPSLPSPYCFGDTAQITLYNDTLNLSSSWASSNGSTISVGGLHILTYIPNQIGTDTISFTISNGFQRCEQMFTTTITTPPCLHCNPSYVFPNPLQTYTSLYDSNKLGNVYSGPTVYPPGYYFLSSPTGTLTINGNVSFDSATVLIDSNTLIQLSPGAHFNVMSSHLFSCSRWKGIRVSDSTAQLNIDGSLIEDADTAVRCRYISMTENVVFSATNSIFNRNFIDIDLDSSPNVNTIFPFYILGNVFTNRDFSGYPGYPQLFPPLYGYLGLKNSVTPFNPYTPPYGIDVYGFPLSQTKMGRNTWAGINLNYVGHTIEGGANGYAEIQIPDQGDNNHNNFFDNLDNGIYATNSNFSSNGNVFMNLASDTTILHKFTNYSLQNDSSFSPFGVAIRSFTDFGLKTRMRVSNNGGNFNNQIYIPKINVIDTPNQEYKGIYATNNYNITINNCFIISNFNSADSILNAENNVGNHILGSTVGIDIEADISDSIIISNNKLINLNFALLYQHGDSINSAINYVGTVNINDNVFSAVADGITYSTDSGGFMFQAIEVASVASNSSAFGTININDNKIDNVAQGILFDFTDNNIISNVKRDTINMNSYPNNFPYNTIGIYLEGLTNAFIEQNIITATESTLYRGIWSTECHQIDISCNTISNIGRCFEFQNCDSNIIWSNNAMSNYICGLCLEGAASFLGMQGTPTNSSGNTWSMTPMTGTSDTYIENSANPLGSILFVGTLPGEFPQINNVGIFGVTPYSISSGTIQFSSGGSSVNCMKQKFVSNLDVKVPKQNYMLYPNPGTGDINIIQEHLDNDTYIKIIDDEGRSLYNNSIKFNNKLGKLNMVLIPGIYMILITDSNGKLYSIKYIAY